MSCRPFARSPQVRLANRALASLCSKPLFALAERNETEPSEMQRKRRTGSARTRSSNGLAVCANCYGTQLECRAEKYRCRRRRLARLRPQTIARKQFASCVAHTTQVSASSRGGRFDPSDLSVSLLCVRSCGSTSHRIAKASKRGALLRSKIASKPSHCLRRRRLRVGPVPSRATDPLRCIANVGANIAHLPAHCALSAPLCLFVCRRRRPSGQLLANKCARGS